MNVLKRIGGAILGVIIVALVIGVLFPDSTNDAWLGVALVVGAIFGALFPKVTLFIPFLLFIIYRKMRQPPERDPEKEAIPMGFSGRLKKK